MKIRPVEAELFQANGGADRDGQRDRQRDLTKVAFCNFANAPKIERQE